MESGEREGFTGISVAVGAAEVVDLYFTATALRLLGDSPRSGQSYEDGVADTLSWLFLGGEHPYGRCNEWRKCCD